MNKKEIQRILSAHALWLVDAEKGQCAKLWDANLRGANLRGANLQCAKLRDADLRGANLRGANLRGANLQCADLRDADLRGANLLDAKLQGADLRGVVLDFASWPLWCGSISPNVDDRIAKQLMYHALAVAIPHIPKGIGTKKLIEWANGFHRVVDGEVEPLPGL